MITLDSFRKPWLRRRIAEVEAEGDVHRRSILTSDLRRMDIEPESKVGQYVLDHFKPEVVPGGDDAFGESNIFDLLTLLTNEDVT